jgi:hypothetical protein
MSMLLPTQGQLPAAVAAAIAATSPGATPSDGRPAVSAPDAVRPSTLKAIRDSLDPHSFELVTWVAELQTRLDDQTATFADIRQLVAARTAWLNKGVAIVATWADARVAEMEHAGGDIARHAEDAMTSGRLAAFALRAGAAVPASLPDSARDGAEAVIHATLQPLYSAVDQVRLIEARLVLNAKRAALKADIRSMAARNVEMIRLAKAEFIRVVADTARLAFKEVPPREVRAVAREAVLTLPVDASSKPFGKRIDYHGLAGRWVATP